MGLCVTNSCTADDIRIKLARDNIEGIAVGAVGGWGAMFHLNVVRNCKSHADEAELTPGDKGFV